MWFSKILPFQTPQSFPRPRIATYNAGVQFAGGVRLSAREARILLASAAGVPSVARIVAFDGLVEISTFNPFGTAYNKGQFIG